MHEGDKGFTAFVDAEYNRLIGAVTLFCGDVEVAREVVQEALARAYQRWARVSKMDRPGGWLHVVAFNLARSRFRRRAAERRAQARAHVPAHEDAPEVADQVVVREAVSRLPLRQREVVIHRYFLGRSVAETAELLGVSRGAVTAATFKGIASLRLQFDFVLPSAEESRHA